MPGVIVAAVLRPVIAHDFSHACLAHREDVEPQQNRPDPVLLAHMARSGPGTFLAADADLVGIQQRAEEFPSSRRFKTGDALRFGDLVGSSAGRHRAGDAL